MHFGIDVGGTKTEFAVFDQAFARVHSLRINTPIDDYNQFLKTIAKLVKDGDRDFGADSTVGVGVTGIVDEAGRSFSANVPCLNKNDVRTDLRQAIGRDVHCINDVRAFALSEARGGAAEGFSTMVGIILGTGAASGFCRDGVPRIGTDGVAGEWGHLSMPATLMQKYDLPMYDCTCGKSGCIEMYVSGPGLSRLATHFFGEDCTSVKCVAEMRRGNKVAKRVFDIWIDCVGDVVAQLVLHSNPDIIVIGGGMSNIEELYDCLPNAAQRLLLTGVTTPPIRRAMFGDDSGVRGAAIVGAGV